MPTTTPDIKVRAVMALGGSLLGLPATIALPCALLAGGQCLLASGSLLVQAALLLEATLVLVLLLPVLKSKGFVPWAQLPRWLLTSLAPPPSPIYLHCHHHRLIHSSMTVSFSALCAVSSRRRGPGLHRSL
jgi:hypothetical protein